MIILRGDNKNVDFESPLNLKEIKFERFINYLKNSFIFVETLEVEKFRSERLGSKFFIREWSSDEDALLFDISITTEDMARKLGRSWMSVDIRRGIIMPQILDYANKKGVDIYKVDIKELIENYRKEHQEKIKKGREERKREREELRYRKMEYLALKKDIPAYESLIDTPISLITKEELNTKKHRLEILEKEFEKENRKI